MEKENFKKINEELKESNMQLKVENQALSEKNQELRYTLGSCEEQLELLKDEVVGMQLTDKQKEELERLKGEQY